ncbi:MAG: ATP-grasp domain-containing protein, partial [Opitutae bacterium]|nr:ATP-grasp domain-containing protein [Opitutae bacterium]
MNILFSCAGRRAYLLEYFRKALDKVGSGKIFAADMSLTAPALAFADVKIQVPSVYDDGYVETLIDICRGNKIDALISLNDLELPLLAVSRERFAVAGTFVVISSERVIDICFDKLKTAEFVASIGLNSPKTFVSLAAAQSAIAAGELSFPLVLKPRRGSGSIGIEFVESCDELAEMYGVVRRKIEKSILANASADRDGILIQEAIVGAEYGLDVMNDFSGNTVAVSVKRKLAMRAGETDKAIVVDNGEIREMGFRIGNSLRHIANLDCDILERGGKYFVLELNPRFGGGYPFSQEAGVNLPLAILKWLRGERVDAAALLAGTVGLAFAKCDRLVSLPPS